MMHFGRIDMMNVHRMSVSATGTRTLAAYERRREKQNHKNADHVFHNPQVYQTDETVSMRRIRRHQKDSDRDTPAVKFQLSVQCPVAS